MTKLQRIYLSDEADMDIFNSWGTGFDEEDDDWDDSEFEDD